MWANEQGTDGYLPVTSLRLFHPAGLDVTTIDELIRAGIWQHATDGYQVTEWGLTQSFAADLERVRKLNRDRAAAWRAAHLSDRA